MPLIRKIRRANLGKSKTLRWPTNWAQAGKRRDKFTNRLSLGLGAVANFSLASRNKAPPTTTGS